MTIFHETLDEIELIQAGEPVVDDVANRPHIKLFENTLANHEALQSFSLDNVSYGRPMSSDPPSNRVTFVDGAKYRSTDDKYIIVIDPGVQSPPFDPITTPGMYRFDLLCGDDEGNIIIVKGEEVYQDDPVHMAPDFPADYMVFAIIRITEASNVAIEDHDIFDARPFLNSGGFNFAAKGVVNFRNYKTSRSYFWVDPFVFISPINGLRPRYFSGGNTPSFAPIQSGQGYDRYDLVVVNDNSELEIIQGDELQPQPGDTPYSRCPDIPVDKIALYIVHITETSAPWIKREHITCIAEYLSKGLGSAGAGTGPIVGLPVFFEVATYTSGNTETHWVLQNGSIDTSLPYLVVQDGVALEEGNGFTVVNANEIQFDNAPQQFTLICQVTASNFTDYGLRYVLDDTWNGIDTSWDIGFNLDVTRPYILVEDGVALAIGYAASLSGTNINFDNAPQSFTQLHALTTDNDGVDWAFKDTWDGTTSVWDPGFAVDSSKPLIVVEDGVFLWENRGFSIVSGQIVFQTPPQSWTFVWNCSQLVGSGNVVIPTQTAYETSWDGTQTAWVLPFNISAGQMYIVIEDGQFLFPGNGFTLTNANTITFDVAPTQFTYIILFDTNDPSIYKLEHYSKADWDGTTNIWDLGFQLDGSKIYLCIEDHFEVREGAGFTINGTQIVFDINPVGYTELYYINTDAPNLYGWRQEYKDTWNGTDTIWVLSEPLDLSKPYIMVSDGVSLRNGYGFTLNNGTEVQFDVAPTQFTHLIAIEMSNSSNSGGSADQFGGNTGAGNVVLLSKYKSDWNGLTAQWTLNGTPDMNYPILVIADNLPLEGGVDYTINNNVITFTNNPSKFTAIFYYNTDANTHLFNVVTKTDWDGTATQWDLSLEPDIGTNYLVVSDNVILEPGVDFTKTNNVLTFVNAPQKFTMIMYQYASGANEVPKFVYKTSFTGTSNTWDTGVSNVSKYIVIADNLPLEPGVDFTIDANGVITFQNAPQKWAIMYYFI